MNFYKSVIKENSKIEFDFYSNGKLFIDFDTLFKAFENTKFTGIFWGNEKSVDSKITVIPNVSPKENLELLSKSKTMIVSVVKGHKNICGVTSINDALAMYKPIIVSDSCNIGFLPENEGIGYTFEVGNATDLQNKMKIVLEPINYENIQRNIASFLTRNCFGKFENLIKKFVIN